MNRFKHTTQVQEFAQVIVNRNAYVRNLTSTAIRQSGKFDIVFGVGFFPFYNLDKSSA